MSKKFLKISLVLCFFLLLSSQLTIFADDPNDPTYPGNKKAYNIPQPKEWLPKIEVPGIPNGGIEYVEKNIVPFALYTLLFLVVIFSLIMLLVGGIMWISGKGEKEAMAKAKGTVSYALIGLVLGLSSFLILNTLGAILGIKFTP